MTQLGSVLVTGARGFTGRCLLPTLRNKGYEVHELSSNLLDYDGVKWEVSQLEPSFVIHLAGISSTIYENELELYNVNFVATCNLLKALSSCSALPRKTVLASSSYVYGSQKSKFLHEELNPNPESHYALSKYFLEKVAKRYPQLNTICTRPFNYTGIYQPEAFVIPKLVNAYKNRVEVLPIGNLQTRREFNDVRDVAKTYVELLQSDLNSGVVNISSGRSVSIVHIVEQLQQISQFEVQLQVDEKLLHRPDADIIVGSNIKLQQHVSANFQYTINDTLAWMYESS